MTRESFVHIPGDSFRMPARRLALSLSICFHKDSMGLGIRKFYATTGVDVTAVSTTPSGEGCRINVSFDDEVALSDISLVTLFREILPLQEGTRESMPVSEQGTKRLVVTFEIPRHANGLDLLVHDSSAVGQDEIDQPKKIHANLIPSPASIKAAASIAMAGRCFPTSTELYLVVETDLPEFWIALAHQEKHENPIGFLHYVRCRECTELIAGRAVATFELQEVLPASFPAPCPIFSLSGVLWTRLAAIEAHQALTSFQEQASQRTQSATPSAQGGLPHEV